MPELQFAEGLLARLRALEGDRYDERAYIFQLAAIEYLQTQLDVRRHVSGQELAWACRDLALQRFGVMARTVLGCWGVQETGDFGRIVFALAKVGLLATQPSDHIEDFEDVFDFVHAFDESYQLGGPLSGA